MKTKKKMEAGNVWTGACLSKCVTIMTTFRVFFFKCFMEALPDALNSRRQLLEKRKKKRKGIHLESNGELHLMVMKR